MKWVDRPVSMARAQSNGSIVEVRQAFIIRDNEFVTEISYDYGEFERCENPEPGIKLHVFVWTKLRQHVRSTPQRLEDSRLWC